MVVKKESWIVSGEYDAQLSYQACDGKICFLPTWVPMQWQPRVLPLDWQGAPEDIRHK
jgi:hypothetical protein